MIVVYQTRDETFCAMELEALLAPISGASPCGEDMSFSIEFDQIADMRRQDDPTLDQGEWVTSLKVADWPGVVQSCQGLLQTRTKDLRLAMWLTEALALSSGYEGLDKGLALCTRLCELYWGALHPQADGGDVEERAGNIAWLLNRIVSLSRAMPITQGRQGGPYSLMDLDAARLPSSSAGAGTDQTQAPADRPTLEQIQRALRETPAPYLLATLQAAQHCASHLLAWQAIVDAHLGADGPGFVQAKEALSSVVHDLTRLAREYGALHADASPASTNTMGDVAAPEEAAHTSAATAGVAGGPPCTRTQALQQLREVASYFRRTEPHSPVAYLAEKAVKWGEMPLHEWLRKVIKDQGAMSHLEELLGLDPKAQPDGH